MNVLMITPGVDESQDILGFTASWVRELSKRVAKLYVITPYFNKETILPANSIVYGLNEKPNKLTKYLYLSSLMVKLLSQKQVDVIFCHVGPSSVLWVAPWAKLFRVPIVHWYSHRAVSWRLRLADVLASRVVTASEESYHLKSNKVIITGHGVETDKFKPAINTQRRGDRSLILSVGRISPIKDYETLIEAASILINDKGIRNLEFVIVGGVGLAAHKKYYQRIKNTVEELELQDYVQFVGWVPHSQVVHYYQSCDLFVNMCPTGGMDKAVLEAMACGKPVIVANETFGQLLYPYDNLCLFSHHDSQDMAVKLENILDSTQKWREMGGHNRSQVIRNHSVFQLTDSLIRIFKEVGRRNQFCSSIEKCR